jgi:restriction endonuclease S subunit
MNGWVEKRLGEVCTLQRGFDLPTKQRKKGDYPLISSSGCIDSQAEAKVSGPGVVTGRSGSIGSVFFVDKDFWPLNTTLYVKDFHGNDPRQNHFWIQEYQLDSVTIDADLKEIDILRKGDILTVRSNGNKELIGRCILADDISEKISHSGFTIRIRIESEDIYPQFIVYSLKSRHIRKQLIESGCGINISSLNQQGLSLIKLSFPTFVEQKAIVANIDELAIEAQRLEAIYRKKLAALNELKQSILQKAFTGELTADTPKTVKEEIAA